MQKGKKTDALQYNRLRCMLAIIACTALCIIVFLGVCEQLIFNPESDFPEVGWKSYHLFTILSNMLMAVAAAMCIPYAVDGIRNHNYHLPRWYVDLMYMGVTSVTITFLVAVSIISAAMGFFKTMLWNNNFLLHTLGPILAIAVFLIINSDHRIGFRKTFLAIAPVAVYGLIYIIMVFVIGEDAGGWRDHYEVSTVTDYVPVPVAYLIMLVLSFGLATVLRLVHNAIHRKTRAELEKYYQTEKAFSYPDIELAIRALADYSKPLDKGGELTLPRRAMTILEKKYRSGLSMEEMCRIYLNEYYS